jgi:hypothetical protein
MSKKLIGVIIGPSGIGKVHLRELINFGFKNIALVGKRFRKERVNLLPKEYKNINFYNLKSINEIKKIRPKIINLCSPTEYHYDHIFIIKNFCKNLIIEKPIFWIKNKNESNLKAVKDLLSSKNNKIFINLPMISLANQIKKEIKSKKINKFNFNYFTNGKNKFENIPIDLLPHALSFLLTLNSNMINNFNILNMNKKKNSWNCKIIINDCLCKFFFKQDPKRNESRLSFKINDDTYLRKQLVKDNIHTTKVLKNKKKLIDLKNPMSDYLNSIFKNLNNKDILRKNNDITINSIKIMEKLISY